MAQFNAIRPELQLQRAPTPTQVAVAHIDLPHPTVITGIVGTTGAGRAAPQPVFSTRKTLLLGTKR